MKYNIKYEDYFPHIFESSKATKTSLYSLLEALGNVNFGVLTPYQEKKSNDYLVKRIDDALNRQVIFYLNQLVSNEDINYLNPNLRDKLIESSPSSLFETQPRAINFCDLNESISELKKSPSFKSYINLFIKKGISFTNYKMNKDIIENELKAIILRLENNNSTSSLVPSKTMFRYDKLNDLKKNYGISKKIKSNKNDYSVVLFDSYYFEVLIDQVSNSKKSIDILMFYFALDRRKKSAITTKLFNAIIAAHKRGVEVNVVLDRDKEGQKYYTREINKNTIINLKKVGINARFDSEEKVVHSKLVVIDSKILFLGSHNFSISSSFRYDEVSVMIKNTEIAKYYKGFINNI